MDAVTYPAAGNVALQQVADPEPAAGEALIAVHASGICHTDIDVLHARYGPGGFPIVPGHEYSGEVVDIGTDVSGIAVGDRVVVDPNISCGTCRPCRRGQANLCESLGAYGVTLDGGFAEFSAVRADNLVKIADMPFEMAALAEPMGCVLNGVRAVAPGPEDEVLVFGAGPIGLLMGMALRTRNVSRVTFADVDPARLDLAESFGFSGVSVGSAELETMRRGVDLSVDATGKTAVASGLVDYTANGGACLFFGVCPPDATITVAPFEIFRRQLTLAGTHSLNHNIQAALDAIRACGPDIARLVSHRLPLAEIPEILSGRPPTGSLKIQAVLS